MNGVDFQKELLALRRDAQQEFVDSVEIFSGDPSDENLQLIGSKLSRLRKLEAASYWHLVYTDGSPDLESLWRGGGGGFSGGGASGGW